LIFREVVYDVAMERQIVTVGIDGQVVLPSEVQAALHLGPGSSVEVSIDDCRVILNPLPLEGTAAELPPSVVDLRGIFSGSPSLEDDLLALRRSDQW
jgi:AbrB family looped-hinge helix DNA binding protein